MAAVNLCGAAVKNGRVAKETKLMGLLSNAWSAVSPKSKQRANS
jgi:hypothetical protein